MHFEILVEDKSGKEMLDILVPKIIGHEHSFKVSAYKGIGRIPKSLKAGSDASKRILLDQLPRLIQGFGKTFAGRQNYPSAVIVVCDLDRKCLYDFRKELRGVLSACEPRPETRFCIAVEEGEAWLLGDVAAIKAAYPKAQDAVLTGYENDSICGTWECLARAIDANLANKAWPETGFQKSIWAGRIAPHMDVNNNASPSFNYFRQKLLELAGGKRK